MEAEENNTTPALPSHMVERPTRHRNQLKRVSLCEADGGSSPARS